MSVENFCKKSGITKEQFFGKEKITGYLDLRSLTSIPDGFNPTVGGSLDLRSNLSCQTKTPPKILEWHNGKFICVDGILTEVISIKGKVKKVRIVGQKNESYLVTDGKGKYSHGETLKKAKSDLMFKISNRDKSDYSGLSLSSELTIEKAIECYRVITGACSEGTKHFVKSQLKEVKKKYLISEIIEATRGQYGNNIFSNFFVK